MSNLHIQATTSFTRLPARLSAISLQYVNVSS